MPTNTYVALAKTTITVANTDTVLFESIPSTYTDLRLVVSGNVESGTNNAFIAFNNDFNVNTGSGTTIIGNGTTATSSRRTNDSVIFMTIPLVTSSTTKSIWVVDIMNYASTNMFKTVLWRYSDAGNRTQAGVGLKQLTSSITSLNFSTGAGVSKGNWAVGSTFSLYGIAAAPTSPKATGGTIYSDSTYWYHVFGATETFTPSQALTADVLVVAGGGASGSRLAGEGNCAGGGAGGLRNITSQSLSNGVAYTCTIGSGGAAAGVTNFGARGGTGTNSSFSGSGFTTINASGGGGGGAQTNTQGVNLAIQQGGTGGSAGGSAFDGNGNNPASSVAGNSGGYSPAEGNAGGSGGTGAPNYIMGGGGGAGGAGVSTYEAWSTTGTGGPGITYSNGQVYAKGGNGQSNTGPGLINTGNGGNGWGGGNAGGSGIVIVRYAK